jgi:hypothetical protein
MREPFFSVSIIGATNGLAQSRFGAFREKRMRFAASALNRSGSLVARDKVPREI